MRKRWIAAMLAGCLGGCTTTQPPQATLSHLPAPPTSAQPIQTVAAVAEAPQANPAGDVPLTLDDLLALAVKSHPVLSVARARIEAARGKLIQVGLYPNPTVTPREDELNNTLGRGGKQGVTFTQEIVIKKKLKLAQEAASHGVEAADWQSLTDWYDLRARVRAAFYELLTAGGDVKANREIVRITEQALGAAKRLEKGGTATRPDVVRAEVEHEQSQVRLNVAERRLEAAGRLLAAAVGVPALPCGPDGPLIVGNLEGLTPVLEWKPLLETMLTRSSEVQQANALALQAEGLLNRAEADAWPNPSFTVRPVNNTIDHDFEVLFELALPIPIFNKNQGNILAAQADVARTHAEVQQVELRLTERLTGAYQRYMAARRQARAYRETILPNAEEALKLVRTGYEKGDPKYDFTTFLQAEQTLAQARLAEVQARGDLWRAFAEIRGLVQDEGKGEAGAPRPGALPAPAEAAPPPAMLPLP
jgi:cobalt-zinc-cadmium efflux system outer membrane protein